MPFKMKYQIKKDYLDKGSKKRSGDQIEEVKFVVAHDTGTKGKSARERLQYHKENQNNEESSVHTIIDARQIIEVIPTGLADDEQAEKAHHVSDEKLTDNQIYGGNANDHAIGVELCFGKKVNSRMAYKRYVWYLAYICFIHKLNPSWDVIGHMLLAPGSESDPQDALTTKGKTYEEMLQDVADEYQECAIPDPESSEFMLEEGSEGSKVKKLQENLDLLGFNTGTADGIYGEKTKNGVIQLQTKLDLEVDGIVGPATEFKIQEQVSKKRSDS